jgi:GTP-binding protein LepA
LRHFPPPKGDTAAPLRALIIDSWFDPYHGAVVMMRLFDGTVEKGTKIRMMASGKAFEVLRLGVFSPGPTEVTELKAGEVGFLMAGIKEVAETQIGDTITTDERPAAAALPGFNR